MRSVRIAICTSGDPVSVSCSRCSAMVAVLSGIRVALHPRMRFLECFGSMLWREVRRARGRDAPSGYQPGVRSPPWPIPVGGMSPISPKSLTSPRGASYGSAVPAPYASKSWNGASAPAGARGASTPTRPTPGSRCASTWPTRPRWGRGSGPVSWSGWAPPSGWWRPTSAPRPATASWPWTACARAWPRPCGWLRPATPPRPAGGPGSGGWRTSAAGGRSSASAAWARCASRATTASRPGSGGEHGAGGHHVAPHLGHELVHRLEGDLAFPHRSHEAHLRPLAVQVAVEVEQVGLDHGGTVAVEGGARAHGDGGPVQAAVGPLVPARVDPVGGKQYRARRGGVGRGEAQLPSPGVAPLHRAPHLVGPAQEAGGLDHVAFDQELADAGGADGRGALGVGDQRKVGHLEVELGAHRAQELDVAPAAVAEVEAVVGADRHHAPGCGPGAGAQVGYDLHDRRLLVGGQHH